MRQLSALLHVLSERGMGVAVGTGSRAEDLVKYLTIVRYLTRAIAVYYFLFCLVYGGHGNTINLS